MTLLNFAFKNISRDFKTYIYHFMSCVLSVFVFFTFSNLTFHPSLKIVDKDSTIGLILHLGLITTMLFSFVFILFSIGNFLKQRSKQFAVLNIIGANRKQFFKLIFYENGIISGFSLLFGMTLGLIFSKLFLMIAEKIIGGLNLDFYFPLTAILYTLCLMGGLFLLISIFAPLILRKQKIISLLKKEETAERNHILFVAFLFSVFLPLTIYYNYKLDILEYPFLLITFIIFTYLLFNLMFMVYAFLMKVTQRQYQGEGLVKMSNFKYRINTNLKTMTMTMLLFTITLSFLIYIIGAPKTIDSTTKKIMPYSYMYTAWDKKIDDLSQSQLITDKLKDKEGFQKVRVDFLNFDEKHRDVILSNSTYNKIATLLNRKHLSLKDNEYFIVGVDGKNVPTLGEMQGKDYKHLGISKKIGSDKRLIALSGYFSSVTIVADEKYQSLKHKFVNDRFFAFNIKNWKTESDATLKNDFKINGDRETLTSAFSYYQFEKIQRHIIAYVGGILCFSFLIGIASITYSRLYNLAEEEIKKYKAMVKIGMTKKSIKKVLASTIRWVFVLPFLVALFVTWIIVLYIDQYTITSYYGIGLTCSILYLAIEGILYLIIKKKYQRKILKDVFENN
nr:ABC transporter permease [Staphylococcus schleiferi]